MNEYAEQMYTRTQKGMTIGIKGELAVDMKSINIVHPDEAFHSAVYVNEIAVYKNNIIGRVQ